MVYSTFPKYTTLTNKKSSIFRSYNKNAFKDFLHLCYGGKSEILLLIDRPVVIRLTADVLLMGHVI